MLSIMFSAMSEAQLKGMLIFEHMHVCVQKCEKMFKTKDSHQFADNNGYWEG